MKNKFSFNEQDDKMMEDAAEYTFISCSVLQIFSLYTNEMT